MLCLQSSPQVCKGKISYENGLETSIIPMDNSCYQYIGDLHKICVGSATLHSITVIQVKGSISVKGKENVPFNYLCWGKG